MNALRWHAEPAVSVVVPVDNPGPYLAPLLASLREQSEPSLQIVVARSQWLHFVWLQLIRRDVLLREGFRFDESIVHEDVLWSMQLGLRCRRIGFVADPMYGYRNHPGFIRAQPDGGLALMKQVALAAPLQRDLAAEFIRLGLDRVMLEGAEDARSLRRAVCSRTFGRGCRG